MNRQVSNMYKEEKAEALREEQDNFWPEIYNTHKI